MAQTNRYILRITLSDTGKGYYASLSSDGGETWSNVGNETRGRAYWRNYAKQNSYRLRVVNPVAVSV